MGNFTRFLFWVVGIPHHTSSLKSVANKREACLHRNSQNSFQVGKKEKDPEEKEKK